MSFIFASLFSWSRINGSSSTTSIFSGSVMKYGEMNPRSNCIPSTTSRVDSVVFASSTVITPSGPTFSYASATKSPIVVSLWAEMAAIWAFSRRLATGRERPFKRFYGDAEAAIQAPLEIHGTGAGRHIVQALGKYCMRKDRRCARPIADGIAGALCGLPDHLCSEVCFWVLQLDLLGDGDPVVTDNRPSPLLLDEHAFGFWPECDAYSIG